MPSSTNSHATCTTTATTTLLSLPLELRLHIWGLLLSSSSTLIMRSLFIRNNYRNVFMTQQAKNIPTPLFRVCKQIKAEALPILYGRPLWRASCRIEALASQVGIENFGLIRRMCVDVDDLPAIVGSLAVDLAELERDGPRDSGVSLSVSGLSRLDLRLEMESRALVENLISSSRGDGDGQWVSEPGPRQSASANTGTSQCRLRFTHLEVLEVEGYQSLALSERGSRISRSEGLRLCAFAEQILTHHPKLTVLAQQEGGLSGGGSDAVDLTMGRVRWRFLQSELQKSLNEFVVDIGWLRKTLEVLMELDDEKYDGPTRRDSLPMWTNDGRFQQYPYLTSIFTV